MVEYNYSEILPTKVLYKTANVVGEENLFKNKEQVLFYEKEKAVFKGRGSIVLDFGKEYYGRLRLMICFINRTDTTEHNADVRIRLGESAAECCADMNYKESKNYHGVKNCEFNIYQFSELETGHNGFRFARIDVLTDCEFELINCKIIAREEKINNVGYFECNDQLVNDIFSTAVRTVTLCQQNGYVWDGIKRDRIVWIGDLHPEALSILALSGDGDRIVRSLELAAKEAELPFWINGIPAYSMWYILILCEVYYRTGNKDCILNNVDYVKGVLNQVDNCIDSDGTIDFKRAAFDEDMGYFLDWATFDTPDAEIGTKSLFVYALNVGEKLLSMVGENSDICVKIKAKIKGWDNYTERKQIRAFQCLAKGFVDSKDVDLLKKDGAKGLSTFMSYYILKTLANGGENKRAFEIMKEYYGAMLSLGATTFFEDFDMDWLKDNPLPIDSFEREGEKCFHADYGRFCYTNFRHSLCHGWSSGIIPYLYENVVGITQLDVGYKKVKIKPNLCGLKTLRAGICTPYGLLEVFAEEVDGKVSVKVNAPKEIEIEY